MGEKEIHVNETINDDDEFQTDNDNFKWDFRQEELLMAPVLDMQFGIGYSGQVSENLRLSATVGYEFQSWFDMMDRTTANNTGFLGDDDEFEMGGSLEKDTTNLGLEGFFFRINGEF